MGEEHGVTAALRAYHNRHAGESIVVCGCGSSLNDIERPDGCVTIGVNDVGRRFDPDYLVVLNPRNQFTGDRFSHVERSRAKAIFTQLDLRLRHARVVRFRLGRRGGTDWDQDRFPFTQNSPYVAVCLAAFMGARRIGLLGVDFTDHHFFGPTGRHALVNRLAAIDGEYRRLAEALRTRGVELVNLSRQSRLRSLPRARPADFGLVETSPVPADPGPRARVFGVHYRFLSCGEVFSDGLRHAAGSLGVQWSDALWNDLDLPAKVQRFDPDLLLVVHGRRFVQRWGRRFGDRNSAVWLVDEPYEVDDTARWSGSFRHVLVNDAATVPRHVNAHYLPVAHDPRVHFTDGRRRDLDVGFVGGANPARERALVSLARAGLLSYVVGGPWKDAALRRLTLSPNMPHRDVAELYRRTRVVLNVFRERHHFNRDGLPAESLNPRVYEALACGAVVVSERRSEIGEVFPGLPQFEGPEQMIARVEQLLGDRDARERILRACRERLPAHTYAARLQRVLELTTTPVERQEPSMPKPKPKPKPIARPRAPVEPPEGWVDCGGVAEPGDGGTIVLRRQPCADPGSECGLASVAAFREVELHFDVELDPDCVFVAKVHQQSRIDQATNSYHLFARPERAYLAMHGRVLAPVRLQHDRWHSVVLARTGANVVVSVDGRRVAEVRNQQLAEGYCFVGVKGGAARIRRLRLVAPSRPPKPVPAAPSFEVVVPPDDDSLPRVSIITTVYDRVDCLRECLRNVGRLEFRDFEQIVVADCPPADVLERLAAVVRQEGGPRTRLVNLKQRANDWGITPASAGLELARGEHLCFLSDDNGYEPSHFGPLLAALDEDPALGFAYSSCQYGDRRRLRAAPPRFGAIDLGQPLFRRAIFRRHLPGALPFRVMAWDWKMLQHLMTRRVRWRHVDRLTFLFRLRACRQKPAAPRRPAAVSKAAPGVTLITCTRRERQRVFELCEGWMRRQSYGGNVQWIVVDDGPAPVQCSMGQRLVRRRPVAGEPEHTMPLNVLAALPHVRCDRVLLIEDDDAYAPGYLEHYVKLLERAPLVGEVRARYYHLPSRGWKRNRHVQHASLAQTGLRREALPALRRALISDDRSPFVDKRLWRIWNGRRLLFDDSQDRLCLFTGMKGLVPSGSRVSGHDGSESYRYDADESILQKWCAYGVMDYRKYWPHVHRFSHWRRSFRADKPWLVIGKGPTFDCIREVDLARYHSIALNHVVRECGPVTISHAIDAEVFDDDATRAAALERADWIVVADPVHRACKAAGSAAAEVAAGGAYHEIAATGRLVSYHLARGVTPAESPSGICAGYFSVEAALCVAGQLGAREVDLIGIDGGANYAKAFEDLSPLTNGRESFDVQFGELEKIASHYGMRVRRLFGSVGSTV